MFGRIWGVMMLSVLPLCGYGQDIFAIDEDGDTSIAIEEIVVSSRASDANVTGMEMGVSRLDASLLRKIPALMGEVDVVKAVQMMPGVQMTSEGGSGFSVRGGSPDQNLILLDDAVVYNPSHLMGFFSVFNNDFVSSAELYKGDMPLRYGGRLSSLLEVNTIDRQPRRFSGTGGIGLISSRVTLEGPIGERTSWHVGGRRSYADLFLVFAPDKEMRKAILHFFDLNAKLTHRFSTNDVLEASGYWGQDAFGMADMGAMRYGNGAATVAWRHRYSDGLSSRLAFNFSDFTLRMYSDVEELNAKLHNSLRDFQLRLDFDHRAGRYFNLTYGVESTLHHLQPNDAVAMGLGEMPDATQNALEGTVYVSNEHELGSVLTLRYGARLTLFHNGMTYVTAEPRAGLLARTGAHASVKASWSYNTQFLQLANNSSSGSPLDIWFTAGPDIRPQKSHLVSVGYFQNLRNDMFALSAEVYWKGMRNVIDFKDGANLLLNNDLEQEIRSGRGESYGLELSASKERGAWTGFINYTLSRSERTIEGINGGRTFLAPFDKTHSLNLSVSWAISPAWEVSLSWVYGTGNPTTYPIGQYDIGGLTVIRYSDRNAYRFPDYHRMDASATWHIRPYSKRRWRSELNISIYNVYNKKNPWMINFTEGRSEMIYLFGILPSITYNFRF